MLKRIVLLFAVLLFSGLALGQDPPAGNANATKNDGDNGPTFGDISNMSLSDGTTVNFVGGISPSFNSALMAGVNCDACPSTATVAPTTGFSNDALATGGGGSPFDIEDSLGGAFSAQGTNGAAADKVFERAAGKIPRAGSKLQGDQLLDAVQIKVARAKLSPADVHDIGQYTHPYARRV